MPAVRSLIDSLGGQVNGDSNGDAEPKKSKKRKVKAEESEEMSESSSATIELYQRALCCALAKIAGKLSGIEGRSVLTGKSGVTAFKLDLPPKLIPKGKSLCYSLLNNQLEQETTESIRNLVFLKNRRVSFC